MSDELDRSAASEKDWKALVEVEEGRKLFSPLGSSSKIKYTSITASERLVVLGANTGGVYCFASGDLRYLRLLAHKEGGISLMRFSPVGDTLAVVTAANNVCFWEFNVEETIEPKRFHVSTVLKSSPIVAMIWDKRGNRLFYGDEQGRVAIAYVPKLARKFGSSSLFKKNDEMIHMEKASIVQLDYSDNTLLVSSTLRCCIIRIQQDFIEPAVQVGTRMRDGPFGACFHRRWVGKPPVIYSARPGGRLWEANIEGTVVSTLKMRDLIKSPPTPLIRMSTELPPPPSTPSSLPTLHFHHLAIFKKQEMLAWLETALFLYHPASYDLPVWTVELAGITSVQCVGNKIYILHDGNQRVTCLSLLNMDQTLETLVSSGNMSLAHQVVMAYPEVVWSCGSESRAPCVGMVLHSMLSSGQALPEKLVKLVESMDKVESLPAPPSLKQLRDRSPQLAGSAAAHVPKRPAEKEAESSTEDTVSAGVDRGEAGLERNDDEGQVAGKGPGEDTLAGLDQEVPLSQARQSPVLPFDLSGEERTTKPEQHSSSFPNGSLPRAVPCGSVATSVATFHVGGVSSPANVASVSPQEQRFQQPSPGLQLSLSSSPQHPPITIRIGRAEGSGRSGGGADDVVAVSLRKDKKRKGKRSKNRNSLSTGTDKVGHKFPAKVESSPNLEDILEADDPHSTSVSPLHRPSHSNATSAESSPYTSRPSSPPHQEEQPAAIVEERQRAGRSMSLDLTWRRSPELYADEAESLMKVGIQRSASFMSKVRSMAQQTRPAEIVKDFLSSISPIPIANALPPEPGSMPVTSSGVARSVVEGDAVEWQTVTPEEHDGPPILSPTEMVPSPSKTRLPISAETEQFIASVESAMKSLTSPSSLSSLGQIKETIGLWLRDLHCYREYLVTHISSCVESPRNDVFYEPVYCGIDTSLRQSVREMVTLALELEVFSWDGHEEGGEPASEHRFLDLYGALVDVPRARNLLIHRTLATACAQWRNLARISTGRLGSSSLETSADEIREQLLAAPGLVPAIITRAYELDRETFVSVCSRTPEGVSPWEVGAVCFIDRQEEEEGKCDQCTMASYLDSVLGEDGSRSRISASLLGNEEVLLACLSVLLLEGPGKKETISDEGKPLPWSHELSWIHHISLKGLIDMCCRATVESQRTAADICYNKGYWHGFLSLCVVLERKAAVLELVVALQDARLLQVAEQGKMLVTVDDWRSFLRLLKVANISVTGSVAPNELSWNVVVRHLLAAVGPAEIGAILDEELGRDGMELELDHLHQLIVELTAIHRQQRALAHSLLEKLDRYLWAPRPLAIGPQLLAVHQAEDGQRPESMVTTSPPATVSLPTVYMEDAVCHWGVRLPSNRCGTCNVLVSGNMSESQAGAVALHCGHVYHRHCLPEQACVLCFSKNFTAKLTTSSLR